MLHRRGYVEGTWWIGFPIRTWSMNGKIPSTKILKSQIPSSKHQMTNKSQISMSNDLNKVIGKFWLKLTFGNFVLNFEFRSLWFVWYLCFGIWDLRILVLGTWDLVFRVGIINGLFSRTNFLDNAPAIIIVRYSSHPQLTALSAPGFLYRDLTRGCSLCFDSEHQPPEFILTHLS